MDFQKLDYICHIHYILLENVIIILQHKLFIPFQLQKKGDNQEALNLSTLIDLYTQLISERLAATDTELQKEYLKYLKK